MTEENNKNNYLNTEKINDSEISKINITKKNEDIIKRLKDIHCKSEERTFDLNEKFNQIKEDLQKLIDEYKIESDKSEEEEELDFSSIEEYINDYLAKERNNSIDSINNAFENVNNNIENFVEDKNSNINNIQNIFLKLKNEFDSNCKEVINHMLETNSQKDEIINKLNEQMNEQFNKICDLIDRECQNLNYNKIERINKIQNLIRNLLNYIKNQKIK